MKEKIKEEVLEGYNTPQIDKWKEECPFTLSRVMDKTISKTAKAILKIVENFEKTPCEFCGTPVYCADGETECHNWINFKNEIKKMV